MAKAPTPLLSPASAAAAAARVAALPSSSPELLESLGLSKYAARFVAEDLTETAMLLAIIELPDGKADLRAVLSDLGMSVGHRAPPRIARRRRVRPRAAPGVSVWVALSDHRIDSHY